MKKLKLTPKEIDQRAKDYLADNERSKAINKSVEAHKAKIKALAGKVSADENDRHLLFGEEYAIGYKLVEGQPSVDMAQFEKLVLPKYKEMCYTRTVDPVILANLIEKGIIDAKVAARILVRGTSQKRIFVSTIEKLQEEDNKAKA